MNAQEEIAVKHLLRALAPVATAVRKNQSRENQNRRKERSPENPGPSRSKKTPAQGVTVALLNQRGKTRGKNETPRKKRKSVDQGDVAQKMRNADPKDVVQIMANVDQKDVAQITKIFAQAQNHQRLK